jgi:hypothetical protein
MLQVQIGDIGIIVLEPENLRRVQAGEPINVHMEKFTNLRVLAIDFTTDAEWLAEALTKHLQSGGDPSKFPDLIRESAQRPEPPLRPNHPPLMYSSPGQTKGEA